MLSPEPVDAPGPGWIADLLPGTAAVYRNPALLWRSARAIFARGTLVTPGDMRPMIEAAAKGKVPAGLAAASYRAEGKDAAAGGIGRQNVLDFRRGYTPGSGAWDPDTHTPTRLEDRPQVTLRLAQWEGGRIVPYAPVLGGGSRDDVRRAWSSSEVSVAEHRLAACPLPPKWHAAGQAARQGWGRWSGKASGSCWRCSGRRTRTASIHWPGRTGTVRRSRPATRYSRGFAVACHSATAIKLPLRSLSNRITERSKLRPQPHLPAESDRSGNVLT